MKVWERMLMKDFQVAVPIPPSEADEEESLRQPSEGEDNVARWKRVAKLAVLRSANHRWSQVRILFTLFTSCLFVRLIELFIKKHCRW